MNKKKFLEEVQEIVINRGDNYGSASYNLQNIANLWSEYKGTGFSVQDVGIMMMLLKIARMKTDRSADSWLDIAGYSAITYEAICDIEGSLHHHEGQQNIVPMKQD